MILWGPAGTGKTTLARILASSAGYAVESLSAVTSGVKDVREALSRAHDRLGEQNQRTVLFIDEVHRFNKSQQDLLLPATETGQVVLIGATTENPYFEVNAALMSRSTLWRLHPLSDDDLVVLVHRGLELRKSSITDEALEAITAASDGDARVALTTLDTAIVLARAQDAASRPGPGRARRPGARRSPLSPVARHALRPDQRLHQVGSRIGPRRRALLAGHHARERREPAVLRATPRHPRQRGHRSRRSHGPGPRRRRRANRRVHRTARRSTDPGARHDHARPYAQEQFGHASAGRGDVAPCKRAAWSRYPITCAGRTTAAPPNRASARTTSTRTTIERGWVDQQYLPDALVGQHFYDPASTDARRRWSNSGARWCNARTRPIPGLR